MPARPKNRAIARKEQQENGEGEEGSKEGPDPVLEAYGARDSYSKAQNGDRDERFAPVEGERSRKRDHDHDHVDEAYR
jgi:hypothetical protein